MATDNSKLNIVAVGASAGGVEALKEFVSGLPTDLPSAILVVLHVPAEAPSVLARILARDATLPTAEAVDGERLQPGTIRVAMPNRHLLVDDNRIVLSEGPTENSHRPAVNALFRSVALTFGPRAVGVLLSGVLDDGTLGLAAIRSRGGTTIAQLPGEALFPTMPLSAIEAGVVDHEVSAAEIGGLLKQLANRRFEERERQADFRMELENRIAMARRFSTEIGAEALGPPAGSALLRAVDDEVETALCIAIRSLQEKSQLSRRLAEHVTPGLLSKHYEASAGEAEHATAVLSERLSEVYRRDRVGDE
jgi:two-component system chemotaxis response regulator CheB